MILLTLPQVSDLEPSLPPRFKHQPSIEHSLKVQVPALISSCEWWSSPWWFTHITPHPGGHLRQEDGLNLSLYNESHPSLDYSTRPCFKKKQKQKLGWRDDSTVKRTCCPCRGLGVRIPALTSVAHNHRKLPFQEFWHSLLASMTTRLMYR